MKRLMLALSFLAAVPLMSCAASEKGADERGAQFKMASFEFFVLQLGDELVLPPKLDDADLVVERRSDIPAKAAAAVAIAEAFDVRERDEALRELAGLPFFKSSTVGQAYVQDPDDRALVFGFPRERCPIHVAKKADGLSAALVSAYARCLEVMPSTPFSGGCGCRVEALGTHLMVDPSVLAYRERLPLSMITLDLSTADNAPTVLRGSVRAGELAGKQMPVELLTADGDSLCKGSFDVETIGSLDFAIQCPGTGIDYSGWAGLVGYHHGRSYGVGAGSAVGGPPDQVLMALFGYDEPELSRLEAETVVFMKSWQANSHRRGP